MTQRKYSDLVMGDGFCVREIPEGKEDYIRPLTEMDEVEEAVRKIDNVVSSNLYLMPQNAVYGWLNARKDILLAVGKGETII